MKKILILFLAIFTVATLSAQHKNTYHLKYVGEIVEGEQFTVKSIKLPTTLYLHGIQKDKKNIEFYVVTPKNGNVELQCASHLVNSQLISFNELKNLYQNSSSTLMLELEFEDKQKWSRTKKVFIPWNKVSFRKPAERENEIIIIDFGTITL